MIVTRDEAEPGVTINVPLAGTPASVPPQDLVNTSVALAALSLSVPRVCGHQGQCSISLTQQAPTAGGTPRLPHSEPLSIPRKPVLRE